jgi:hypothetical protein
MQMLVLQLALFAAVRLSRHEFRSSTRGAGQMSLSDCFEQFRSCVQKRLYCTAHKRASEIPLHSSFSERRYSKGKVMHGRSSAIGAILYCLVVLSGGFA